MSVGVGFKGKAPEAVSHAKKYAASRVVAISEETRKGIRVIALASLKGLTTPKQAATYIQKIVGLTPQAAGAVIRFRERLLDGGMAPANVDAAVAKYTAKKIKERAETIARTEVMTALNAGQLQAVKDGQKAGLIDSTWGKEYINTEDNRTCSICSPMGGVRVGINEQFSTGAGEVDSPPLHPRCRCSFALVTDFKKAAPNTGPLPTSAAVADDAPPPAPALSAAEAEAQAAAEAAEKLAQTDAAALARTSFTPYNPDGLSSKEMFMTPEGVYTVERQQLHDAIVRKYVDAFESQANPEFRMLGGGAASGKSTMTKTMDIKRFMKINADEVKDLLPEYRALIAASNKEAAAWAHLESSHIQDLIQEAGIKKRVHMILDGVGNGSLSRMAARLDAMVSEGYKIGRASYVTIDMEDAMARAILRGEQEGRWIPTSVLQDGHRGVSSMLPRAIKDGVLRDVDLFDNSLKDNLRLIATVRDGHLVVKDRALYQKFLQKAQWEAGKAEAEALASQVAKDALKYEAPVVDASAFEAQAKLAVERRAAEKAGMAKKAALAEKEAAEEAARALSAAEAKLAQKALADKMLADEALAALKAEQAAAALAQRIAIEEAAAKKAAQVAAAQLAADEALAAQKMAKAAAEMLAKQEAEAFKAQVYAAAAEKKAAKAALSLAKKEAQANWAVVKAEKAALKQGLLDAKAAKQAMKIEAQAAKQKAIEAKVLAKAEAKAAKLAPKPAPAPSVASAPKPPKPAPKGEPVLNVDAMKKTGDPTGSNKGGGFYTDKDGERWYVKPGDADHVANEILSARLYREMGVTVPDIFAAELNGAPAVASRIVTGVTKKSGSFLAAQASATDGFAVDAFLANWDVAGVGFDNLLWDAHMATAVRIDLGGALRFRAQGLAKGEAFGSKVGEIDFMRLSSKNSKQIFGGMTDQQLIKSMDRVIDLSESRLRDLIETYGPSDPKIRAELADKMAARRVDLLIQREKLIQKTKPIIVSEAKAAQAAEDAAFKLAAEKETAEMEAIHLEKKLEAQKAQALAEKAQPAKFDAYLEAKAKHQHLDEMLDEAVMNDDPISIIDALQKMRDDAKALKLKELKKLSPEDQKAIISVQPSAAKFAEAAKKVEAAMPWNVPDVDFAPPVPAPAPAKVPVLKPKLPTLKDKAIAQAQDALADADWQIAEWVKKKKAMAAADTAAASVVNSAEWQQYQAAAKAKMEAWHALSPAKQNLITASLKTPGSAFKKGASATKTVMSEADNASAYLQAKASHLELSQMYKVATSEAEKDLITAAMQEAQALRQALFQKLTVTQKANLPTASLEAYSAAAKQDAMKLLLKGLKAPAPAAVVSSAPAGSMQAYVEARATHKHLLDLLAKQPASTPLAEKAALQQAVVAAKNARTAAFNLLNPTQQKITKMTSTTINDLEFAKKKAASLISEAKASPKPYAPPASATPVKKTPQVSNPVSVHAAEIDAQISMLKAEEAVLVQAEDRYALDALQRVDPLIKPGVKRDIAWAKKWDQSMLRQSWYADGERGEAAREVLRLLRKDITDQIGAVETEKLYRAVTHYQGSGYVEQNKALRGGTDAMKAAQAKWNKPLEDWIKKQPVKPIGFDGKSVRGVGKSGTKSMTKGLDLDALGLRNPTENSSLKAANERLAKWFNGTEFSDPGFASSSGRLSVGNGFTKDLQAGIGNGMADTGSLFHITGSGRTLQPGLFTGDYSEMEWLSQMGQKYRIDKARLEWRKVYGQNRLIFVFDVTLLPT